MAHAITYSGIQSADGGGIFAGKRFWIAQRIPGRYTLIGRIKNHGGTIAPVEKNADYLIADPKRNDAPLGSYSAKFIDDSVNHGILQLEDRYRIGDPDTPRLAGSGAPGKRTRARFTQAEDAALVLWVLSHPIHRTGNAIYQEFELKNPQHTWQSWRDRWNKRLSNLPQDELERMANSALSQPEARPASDAHATNNGSTSHQTVERGDLRPPPVRRPETPQTREPQPPSDHQESQAQEQDNDPQEQEPEDGEEPYSDQDQFYTDLQEFAQQRDMSVELHPNIGGITIKLWDLANVVHSREVAEDIDWNWVASEMGYARGNRELAGCLQRCWEDNLSLFLEVMADFDEEMEQSDTEEQHEGNNAETPSRTAERVPEIPSEPPSPTSRERRKRCFNDHEALSSRPKRRRLDPNKEIPSTPDHVLKVVRQPPQESPTARKQFPAALIEVRDSQDDSQATLGIPRTPNRRRTIYQSQFPGPDTPGTAQLNTQQSSFDVTPSQQLRFESRLSASPEDLGVDIGRRDRATSSPEPTPGPQPQASATTPDLGSHQHPNASTSPSAPPRPPKVVRRSLPASFTNSPQPPQPPSSPVPQTSPDTQDPFNEPDPRPRRDTPNFDTIEGWVEHYQSMGYPHRTVIAALKATTMTPGGTAAHVMESLRSGQGLPTHHEGVWTDRDDKSLRLVAEAEAGGDLMREASDGQELRLLRGAKREKARLTHKHGADRMALRREFLQAQGQEAQA